MHDTLDLGLRIELVPVAAQRVAHQLRMGLTRPVAGFAGNAQFGHFGFVARLGQEIEALAARQPRMQLVVVLDLRLRPGVVAVDAVVVPSGDVIVEVLIVGVQEGTVHVHPALFAHVPEQVHADVVVAAVGRLRQVLLIAVAANGALDLGDAGDFAARLVQILEEILAVALHRPDRAAPVGHLATVKSPAHGLGRGLLGHGAVVGTMPGCVVILVAGAAAVRAGPGKGVTILGDTASSPQRRVHQQQNSPEQPHRRASSSARIGACLRLGSLDSTRR